MSRTAGAPRTAPGARSRGPVVALLVAHGISLVGTRLSMIALPLFVLVTSGSATRTGVVAMAEMAPYVVTQALAGPVTDRVGARRISVHSDLVSAVVVGLVPLLYLLEALHFGVLVALVAVAGAVRGPGDNAKYVMVPAVARAGGQPVERVLGLEDGISRFASVLGPLGAAALVSTLGPAGALTLDAASFAVSAVVVLVGLRPRHLEPAPSPPGSPAAVPNDEPYLQRLKVGARFVRQDGLLRSIIGMVATTNLLDAALSGVLLAVWAQHRGGGAGLMGMVAASMGAGAVIGAAGAAAFGHRLPRRLAFTLGFLGVGAPRFAVLAFDVPLPVVAVVLFVGGLGCGVINPILGAVELERVPEHLRARVMSLMNSLAWALIPFGGLVGGLLSDRLGIGTTLLACGAVYAVATTLPALRPEWAQMDRRPATETPDPSGAPTPVAVSADE